MPATRKPLTVNVPASIDRILERCLAELSNAIIKRRALIAMDKVDSYHGLDFFRVVKHALYNDVLAHAMRVFDSTRNSASFGHILKKDAVAAERAFANLQIDRVRLEKCANGLKDIRNKTHFHIDAIALNDPSQVWKGADVTGDDLGYLLESGFSVLSSLYLEHTGIEFTIPPYDGSDFLPILKAYKKCHPEAPLVVFDTAYKS